MPDTSSVLVVLLVASALLLWSAVRYLTKKNGFVSRTRKAAKQFRSMADAAVYAEGHLENLASSFAGENGLLVRTAPWGEFQTLSLMTREGPIWFPIGNLSHVSTHIEDNGFDDDGNAKRVYHGVVHMKNGCMYITDDSFDEDRLEIVNARMSAFQNFSKVKKGAVEE